MLKRALLPYLLPNEHPCLCVDVSRTPGQTLKSIWQTALELDLCISMIEMGFTQSSLAAYLLNKVWATSLEQRLLGYLEEIRNQNLS